MSRTVVLGFDLGGTDLKGAVVGADGAVERFVKLPSRAAVSAEGPFEALGLGVCLLDADHDGAMKEEVGSTPTSTNQTTSTGL